MVSTQGRTYPGPDSDCKLGATICNYIVWDAALADDVFKEEPGQLQQVNILPA